MNANCGASLCFCFWRIQSLLNMKVIGHLLLNQRPAKPAPAQPAPVKPVSAKPVVTPSPEPSSKRTRGPRDRRGYGLRQKNQLLRDDDRAQLGITEHHPSFRIGAYTFGGSREIWNTEKHSLAVGSDVTFYSKPSILDSIYGTNPVSWKIFFRLRPQKMSMSGLHGTH